jgi:hypothetical protein
VFPLALNGSFSVMPSTFVLLSVRFINLFHIPLLVTPGFRDPQGLGTAGDRWGASVVRGPGETCREGDGGWATVIRRLWRGRNWGLCPL